MSERLERMLDDIAEGCVAAMFSDELSDHNNSLIDRRKIKLRVIGAMKSALVEFSEMRR